MEYKGQLKNAGKYLKSDFENMNLVGDMTFSNAGMKIKNSTLAFDSINGSFVLNDNDIEINSFSGKTPKSDVYLKGNLKNILAYSLTDDADISIDAVFQSNNFDLDEFLVNQAATTKRDTVYKIKFSPRVNFSLNSNIGRLTFRKFEATNITGTFLLRNQKLIADPISFSAMDGTISASGMIDNTVDSTLLITCDANLKKLNIYKLFTEMEDFGQTMITHENLRGTATADVQFASVWKPDLTIDPNRIYARSNLTVDKGELIKYEPMKALSKYISVSELEDIKFASLQNQIEIKDQKIFIPKMDIQSSALDVTMSGTHTFNNEIDYHFKVLMSDILFNKAKKAKKENDEFGVVEDDKSGKTSLFISMTGTVDEPVIKYDKQGAKQNLKENITEEKHTLKQILREEFGWFKKDTTLYKKDKPKEDGKFIIKWDEEEKEKKKDEDDDF
jgi:VCBS repeat-containing protein